MSKDWSKGFTDQPIVLVGGINRFKANPVVRYLLDEASNGKRCDLNRIAAQDFPSDDMAQFAQLIGYSICGYGDLPYVSTRLYNRAARKAGLGG